MNYERILIDEQASRDFAKQLIACLSAPALLAFNGDLGAGKTSIIRAMLRALGVRAAVKSPSFSLVESYELPLYVLHHFDLYRMEDESELDDIGFREYCHDASICCIEWADRSPALTAYLDLSFSLTVLDRGRKLSALALSQRGEHILAALSKEAL